MLNRCATQLVKLNAGLLDTVNQIAVVVLYPCGPTGYQPLV